MIIVIFIFFISIFIFRLRRRKKYDLMKITLRDIDKMTGFEFEHYLYVFFSVFWDGETYMTKQSGDYGADLFLIDEDGEKIVIQAKRLSDKLGLTAVQEVYAAKAYYGANRAIIVTSTDTISEPCRKLAAATKVRVIDRFELDEMIRLFKKGYFIELQQILDEPYEQVHYNPSSSLEIMEQKRGVIQAGDYFCKV